MENFIAECVRTAALFKSSEIHCGSARLVELIELTSLVLGVLPHEYVLQVNTTLSRGLAELEAKDYVSLSRTLERDLPGTVAQGLGLGCLFGSAAESELGVGLNVEEIICRAFVAPVLEEMKLTYCKNIELLARTNYKGEYLSFDALPFFFVGESASDPHGLFTLYEKGNGFVGKEFSHCSDSNLNLDNIRSDELNDCLFVGCWNVYDIYKFIEQAKGRGKKAYIVLSDVSKFFSSLQGISVDEVLFADAVLFDGVRNFKNYFSTTDTYLPRIIVNFGDSEQLWQSIISDIHAERIRHSSSGQNRKNVLLTIGIPSYNRGKRVLDNVLCLLNSYYDEEIEIIVSNNGTQNETKPYYEQLADLSDSRLKYHCFAANQGPSLNFCKICEMAEGKYILLLSDEDCVDFNSLPKILNILKNEPTLSILRASTKTQFKFAQTVKYTTGKEALFAFMLTSNYMSGNIFNTEMLKQSQALQFVADNQENSACCMYPHMVWELILAQHGSVMGTDVILTIEGKAEKSDLGDSTIGTAVMAKMPAYATIEGRLNQHAGFLDVFLAMEICKQHPRILRDMYIRLCDKTKFLAKLSANVYYSRTDVGIEGIMKKAFDYCREKLDLVYEFIREQDSGSDYKNAYKKDLVLIDQIFKG